MILEGYDVTLQRLRHEDIELVRQMRNADHIRNYMQYQEIITTTQQNNWFASIDNEFNNYFVIVYRGEKCGLISGADIDWMNMETGNGGLFIWDSSLWGTTVPICAALLLTEISFLLGFRKTRIKVLGSNKRAIEFNAQLGYERSAVALPDEMEQYELTKARFYVQTENLRRTMRNLFPGKITAVIDDPAHASSQKIIEAYSRLSKEEQLAFNFIVP